MSSVRRSRFLFFAIDDGPFIDVYRLLRGEAAIRRLRQLYAISLTRGGEYPITLPDLKTLFGIPCDRWISKKALMRRDKVPTDMLDRFLEQGLLISDDDAR